MRTKINKIKLYLAGGTFLLSLFFIFYSLSEIQQSNHRIEKALDSWEKVSVTRGTKEMPILPLNSSSTPTTDSVQTTTPFHPKVNDVIGKLTIPKLRKELPIIEGTNDAQLKQGVGHFIGSAMPGDQSNTVLAGHRDTVFHKIGDLKIKDELILETNAGTFLYHVTDSKIVSPNNISVLQPSDDSLLTLITCYPFNFVGNAPERYIITAKRSKK